jgi:hypothetical protein
MSIDVSAGAREFLCFLCANLGRSDFHRILEKLLRSVGYPLFLLTQISNEVEVGSWVCHFL